VLHATARISTFISLGMGSLGVSSLEKSKSDDNDQGSTGHTDENALKAIA
jgi:hypothetical protein